MPDTINAAAENLLRITNELSEAKEDVALLTRLKGAEDRVARLTAEQGRALVHQNKLLDAEAKARETARFKGIEIVSVVDTTPSRHVLGSSYEITYRRPIYDMYANAAVPTDHMVLGFAGLHSEVLDCLIEKYPFQIPAKILALGPDPRAAMATYLMGLRRGHLRNS